MQARSPGLGCVKVQYPENSGIYYWHGVPEGTPKSQERRRDVRILAYIPSHAKPVTWKRQGPPTGTAAQEI